MKTIPLATITAILALAGAPAGAAAQQGGDTRAEAQAIGALPFNASGTTVGYADDYEVGCGTAPDLSPDVVYSFVPAATGYFAFDLCGSQYDAKLALCDDAGTVLACNDDYDFQDGAGHPCEMDPRLEDVLCAAGTTYYVVIDGYGGAAGTYTLAVSAWTPCEVAIPGNAIAEGEPALTYGGIDSYNCGCGCDGGPAFVDVSADGDGQAVVAVDLGWRAWGVRDHDWFRFTAGAAGSVRVEAESGIEVSVTVYSPVDCGGEMVAVSGASAACATGAIDYYLPAGQEFTVQVRPLQPVPPHGLLPASRAGVLRVSGLASVQPVELTTWGELKSLYR